MNSDFAVLMDRLSHPYRRLKIIQITGTDGAGSVSSLLGRTLRGDGYRVAHYLRCGDGEEGMLYVNGRELGKEAMVPFIGRAEAASGGLRLAAGEKAEAAALLYFAEAVPDYVIWEEKLAGGGAPSGYLHPVVAVLAEASGKYAGDRLKAFVRPGVPIVSSAEREDAVRGLADVAAEKKSPLYLIDRDFGYSALVVNMSRQIFDFWSPYQIVKNVAITLKGQKQMKYAAAALMALELLRRSSAALLTEHSVYEAFELAYI